MARCLVVRGLLAELLRMHIFARQAVASEVRPVSEVRLTTYFLQARALLAAYAAATAAQTGVVDESKDGSTYSALHRYGWGSLTGHNCLFATVPPLPLRWNVAVVRNFVTFYCFVRCSDTTAEPAQAKRDKPRSEVKSPGPTSLHNFYIT